MRPQHRDITGEIGDLYKDQDPPKYPMYSFSRPAWIVWQAVYDGMLDNGFSHEKAMEVLASKHMRWALDGDLSDILKEAAYNYSVKHANEWK